LHRFPATDKPYKKLSLSKAYTFYAAQERIKREGWEWKAFVNNERVILRNYGVNKKGDRKLYGPGYLEPGNSSLSSSSRKMPMEIGFTVLDSSANAGMKFLMTTS